MPTPKTILYIDQRTDWQTVLILPLAVQAAVAEDWLARCQIRGLRNQLVAEPRTTVLPNKSVFLELNRIQTEVDAGKYLFDLLLQSPAGDRRKMVQGTAMIVPTVTVWQAPPVNSPTIPPVVNPAWLNDAIGLAIAQHNLAAHSDLAGSGESIPSRAVFTPEDGQTVFTLVNVPTFPHLSQLFLNGQKMLFIFDYTINGAIINWQDRIRLEASDEFEIFFYE